MNDNIVKAFTDEYFKKIYQVKKNSKLIRFFNGVFDIIHLGHINMIKKVNKNANKISDTTIVAINSNESYEKLNKSHPLVHDEEYRAKVLLSLGADLVIIFDEDTPLDLVMHIQPDLYYKGWDYYEKDYPEKSFIKSYGGSIHYIDLEVIEPNVKYSSSNIYEIISQQVKDEIRESL